MSNLAALVLACGYLALLDRAKAVTGFAGLVLLHVSVIVVSAVDVGVISEVAAVLGDAWKFVDVGHLL